MDYSRRVAEHGKSTCCMSYANHSMTALLFVCAWVLHGRNMAKHVQGMVMYEHSMAKHSKAPPSKDQILSAEVLDSSKKVENQLVSFAAVGVSMDEEAVQEATSTCQAADKIIQVTLLSCMAICSHA